MIRLILIDDQALIRRGLQALLKADTALQVVGEAGNGAEAIALTESLQSSEQLPDVALMDIRMPVMDGVAATQAMGQRFPTVKILVLTTFDDQELVVQALRAGAAGYLLKDTPLEELGQAIRLVAKGYTQMAPGLASKFIDATHTPPPPPALPNSWEGLTPREHEILQWIAKGASNREIAEALYISEKTVRNHITSVLGQLGLRDRTQAAIFMHSHFPGCTADSQP